MKHNRTMTLFVCAIVSVIIALIIASFKELYNNVTNTDNSDINIISLAKSNADARLTNIIMTRDNYIEMYEEIKVFIEDRDNIKFENQDCYGFSPYKVSDMTYSIEQNTISVNMQLNEKVDANDFCSEINLYLPSTIEYIDLSTIASNQLYISSDQAAANLMISSSTNNFDLSGQYNNLVLWQSSLEFEDFDIYSYQSMTLSEISIDTLDIYSNSPRLLIDGEVNLGKATIHTNSHGSLTLYDYSLLQRLDYQPLSSEEIKHLSLPPLAQQALE